jgi:PBSX family phage terminase large subunit
VKHELFGEQYGFVASENHYAALIGGIGSGKSMAGAVRALLASQGTVGSREIRTPNTGIVTAPTWNMLRDATLRSFRDVAGDFIDAKRSAFAPPIRVRMLNGSEILFRSADNPEHLRGANISWWWGDEAALYSPGTWRIMIGRLREFGAHGYAWITTTPKGRNWIWQKFVAGKDGKPQADHAIYRVTTGENPYLDRAFVAALHVDYTGDFAAQELAGEFVAFEGLVYPEFHRERHVSRAGSMPTQFARVIGGVDWGFNNPGVILLIGITADDRIYVIHEEYVRRRAIDEWKDVAVQLRNLRAVAHFVCDPSEPEFIAALRSAGLRAFPANNAVTVGIQAVKRRLANRADGVPGLLLYPGAVNTMGEFEQYRWMSRGETPMDEPVKANDHAMDALRYAIVDADQVSRRRLTAVGEVYA